MLRAEITQTEQLRQLAGAQQEIQRLEEELHLACDVLWQTDAYVFFRSYCCSLLLTIIQPTDQGKNVLFCPVVWSSNQIVWCPTCTIHFLGVTLRSHRCC